MKRKVDMPGYGLKESPDDEFGICMGCLKSIPSGEDFCKNCDPARQDYEYEQWKDRRCGL